MEITGTPGEIYEQHIVPAITARWTPELVELMSLRFGERALDVACGTGVVTRELPYRVGKTGRVVGLDINPGMLAMAFAIAPNLPVEWMEGNACSMPLPNASFDVVVAQQGLQFLPDKPAALAEMRRVLVSGGRLILSVWRSTQHNPAFRALEEALARRIGPAKAALPPYSLGDAPLIRSMLTTAGFKDIHIEAVVKLSRWHTAEHFVRSLVAGAPTMLGELAGQGPAVLDGLVAEITEATSGFVDDRGWTSPQTSHLITAIA
jgi:ubiquinone/menaquinone biosynthesis C-methylase UbiE